MAKLYDVTGHPLLTPKVTGLTGPAQDAQQTIAERLLGLRAPALASEPEVDIVKNAIVLQMNFQVAQGLDPLMELQSASAHSKQSTVWRDRFLNPVALALVTDVLATLNHDEWGEMVSYRTRDAER